MYLNILFIVNNIIVYASRKDSLLFEKNTICFIIIIIIAFYPLSRTLVWTSLAFCKYLAKYLTSLSKIK